MQHIGIILEDERNNLVERSESNFADILNAFYNKIQYEEAVRKYPWLTSIDPYGNTIFNHLQVPHLIRELDEIKTLLGPQATAILEKIIIFVSNRVVESEGLYIKFIGD